MLMPLDRYRDQRNNRIRGGNTTPGNQANDDDESSGAFSSAQSVTPDQEQDSNGCKIPNPRWHSASVLMPSAS